MAISGVINRTIIGTTKLNRNRFNDESDEPIRFRIFFCLYFLCVDISFIPFSSISNQRLSGLDTKKAALSLYNTRVDGIIPNVIFKVGFFGVSRLTRRTCHTDIYT